MSEILSPERIRSLYAEFLASGAHDKWISEFELDLRAIADLDDAALRSPEGQRQVWGAKRLGSTGPWSENLDLTAIFGVAEIASELVVMRAWQEASPSPRAEWLQKHHDIVLERSTAIVAKAPRARLFRAIHAIRPGDLHCGYSDESRAHIDDLLVGAKYTPVKSAVIARARVREALGVEPDLAEHARRSVFCWWLHEQHARIRGLAAPPKPQPYSWTVYPLPLSEQRRYIDPVVGTVDTLLAGLRAAEHGATPGAVRASILAHLGTDAPKSVPATAERNLRYLGLLTTGGDGLLRPAPAGQAALTASDRSPIIEAFIRHAAGFGAMLRHLDAHGPDRGALLAAMAHHCEGRDPVQFTSYLTPWASALGLTAGGALTELGRTWAKRIGPQPPAPPPPERDPDAEPLPEALPWPSLSQLQTALSADAAFLPDPEAVRAIYAAWTFHARKRFVILSGLSGTGKTQILKRLAEAVCAELELEPSRHLAIVPVRPDWRDPSGLLGYLNGLHAEARYEAEPALRLLLAAAEDPGRPYFLILDEMNLARVERYFAPLLSAMETGDDIRLHASDADLDVPASIPWPENLCIGGTVNMDETTHAISDKVLDRAFTLELWEADLPTFFAHQPDADLAVTAALTKLYDALRPARRHFAYRTASEVLGWVARARALDPDAAPTDLLDQAVYAKVLPRLRGAESPELTQALAAALAACDGLTKSAAKIRQMQGQLRATGVCGFWS